MNPPGLPRPRNSAGLPVPWITADAEHLGLKSDKRQRRCAGGWICQVCGLRFSRDEKAYLFASPPPEPQNGLPPPIGETLPDDHLGVHAMDHGLLHRQCALLALRYCPALKKALADDELLAFEVPPGSIEAFGSDAVRVEVTTLR